MSNRMSERMSKMAAGKMKKTMLQSNQNSFELRNFGEYPFFDSFVLAKSLLTGPGTSFDSLPH